MTLPGCLDTCKNDMNHSSKVEPHQQKSSKSEPFTNTK